MADKSPKSSGKKFLTTAELMAAGNISDYTDDRNTAEGQLIGY